MPFKETFIKLVLCMSMIRGQEAVFCEDQSLTPTGADNPLAEFALYHHRRLQASVNQSFQGLSVKECAQFCLQVTREHMFNCSSFEHVTTTRNCLLTSFSCQQNTLSFDSSRDFYQLKGPNGATSCETFSSSSSVVSYLHSSLIRTSTSIQHTPGVGSIPDNNNSLAFIHPTTAIYSESAARSILTKNISSAFIQPTTSIYSESAAGSRFAKNISSAFIQPTTSTYSESVAGSSFAGNISSAFIQPTSSIYSESVAGSSLAKIISSVFSQSTKTIHNTSVAIPATSNISSSVFNHPATTNHTESEASSVSAYNTSSAFIQATRTIHAESTASSIVANNKSEVPGIPPSELNITIVSPTMLHLSWSPGEIQQLKNLWGFRVVYKPIDNNETNAIVVDKHCTELNISGLLSGTMYTVWIMTITANGFGVSSRAINITTPYQGSPGVIINLTVLLINTTWNVQFENDSSEAFKNLSSAIQKSIRDIDQGNSTYKNITNLRLSNHGNRTVAFINALYDRSSTVENFYSLFEALHKHKRLQDQSIEVFQENIPGKPPTNITLLTLSLSSITVEWTLPQSNHCAVFRSTGFRVFYALSNTENATQIHSIDVNRSTNHVVIRQHLEDFQYYLIWLQTITTRGLGPKSRVVKIRTLEKVVSVSVTLQLNVSWVQDLLNKTSDFFSNLTERIERNVYLLYDYHSKLRRVVSHKFRNDSGKVTAEIEVTFGQHVEMSAFTYLYELLYNNGTLGNLTVFIISDNIPGKPPRNLSVDVTSPTSVLIGWDTSPPLYESSIPTIALQIFYKLEANTTAVKSKEMNTTRGYFVLDNLEKFAWYTIWVKSVTSRGLGPESESFRIRTLEEVVSVNATVRLLNEEWSDGLKNTTSEPLVNLSRKIEFNVVQLFLNDTQLRSVDIHYIRNDSGKVVAEMEIIFGQNAKMELFMTLYQALYRNGSLGEFSVEPIWDNIPGKPPSNITAHATSTTSILVEWNAVQNSDNSLLRVFYITAGQQNQTVAQTDVNASENSVEIGNLGKYVNYTIWMKSVSKRGLGIASYPVYVRTLEEVVPVNMTVRLNSMKWNINLSDPESKNFKKLTIKIQQNVYMIYGQETNYIRDVQCHRFRNGSVLADVTIVYAQNVGPQQFAVIYKALYEDGQLGNLSVQPINDNVPGKPPLNVSAESKTSTTIQVTWLCADCHQHNSTIGFLVSYKLDNSNHTVAAVVNRTTRHFLTTGLKKFRNYAISVSSVTIRGIGLASQQVSERTLEDVPSHAPVNLHAHNTSSTTLLVAWEPPPSDHVNGILLGYKVTYRKHGEMHGNSDNINTTQNFTILSGLEKFTAYEVNVSAFTRVGNGPVANVTVSTDQDVPSLPPANIQAYNISSTSLMVTWNPVPEVFTHGIVLGYLVLYKRKKNANSSYVNVTSLVTSVELSNLDKFTIYVVKVLAFTVKGNGAMSNETLVRTDEDVPSLPPAQLTAHNTSSTTLMVTWLPVPDGYVHGILQGYRLLFKIEQDRFYKNVTTANQSLELAGLEKFTNYSLKVLAFTRIGDGSISNHLTVSTDQDVPSLSPQNVSSYNTSSTSLHVRWREVPRGFVHGILLGYSVLFRIASGTRNDSIATTSGTTRDKELQGLEKFTIYEISVLAFTAKGDGPNSTSIYVSTDEDIPSQPPVDLKAHNTSSTSIRVTWGEVPRGFLHGILQGYRVFYKRTGDKNGSYVNVTTSPTTRERRVTGLEKFTEYSAKVLAFTRKGDGAVSLNVSVLTDEDVPSKPPQSVQSYNTSSTSLNVTWQEVPTGFVHGILRSYRVFYSRTKDNGANARQVVVPANKRHVHLTGLEKFTYYTIKVAAFTRIGVGAKSPGVIISTDEDVPSLPPQNVWANNISSTALRAKWNPVPPSFVHGILRGYKVLYKKTNEPSAPYTNLTVPPGVRLKEIYQLRKFTFYTIQVLAFTIKGNGALSPPWNVTTDEDIPSEQPQNVYAKDKTNATEISLSWEPPAEHTIHGILRGFFIWYSIIKLGIHERSPVFPWDYKKKQLPASSNKDTLTDLQTYASYSIRIAAFTSKGYGPIREISSRTCRCRSVMPTNWWNNPPYVTTLSHSNSSDNRGIIPTILEDIIINCCQTCGESGSRTKIDFTKDANKLKAEKKGVIQVKDAIGTETMISFGIAGVMSQEKYHSPEGDAEYVPIMETPGVAFIVAEKRDIHKEVLLAILSCWPAVVIACIMTYLAGIVVWALDMNWNHVDFPKSFISGSLEGLWWSFVTMTTVGYGDRIPKSIPARLFAFLWTWIGIATIAVITSSITASLMSMVFQPEKMLYGTKVAAIANSTEYKLGLRRNAKLDTGHSYGNLYDIYEDLENDRVHAALLDSYSTASESQLFSKDWIRVIEIIPVRYESANGLVLTGDAMKLASCFRHYVQSEKSDIHRIIQRNVGSIKAEDVPFAVKTSSELLTEESYLYIRTVIILGGALGTLALLGLLFHYCFYKKALSTHPSNSGEDVVVVTSSSSQITRSQAVEQLKQDIAEFHDTFRKKYLALRRKHTKELTKLKRLTNGSVEFRRLPEFSTSRRGHYVVTRDVDVNSIFEGMDMSMFDKRSSQRWGIY